MNARIQAHCAEIERCNQRGGRMLSVVDLIEAGTLTRELAAYALAAIGNGASFMVGARPGAAGKTTVMGALLNFVPADVPLLPADGVAAIERGLRDSQPRTCYICHEIGAGPYYAYLWGDTLRRYFELPTVGHMLATNLHADTYEEARDQVCGDNPVSEAAFRRMNLLFFLAVDGRGPAASRRIVSAWESDGEEDHRQVAGEGAAESWADVSRVVSAGDCKTARERIDGMMAQGARTIEDVRRSVLQ